jgi:hypothetical protein
LFSFSPLLTLNAVQCPVLSSDFPSKFLKRIFVSYSKVSPTLYPHFGPPFAIQGREHFSCPNIMTNRSSFPPAQTAPKMSSALSLYLKSNELPRSTSPTSPGKTSRANHLPPSIHPPRRPSCWLLAAAAAVAAAAAAAAASSHTSYGCTPVSTPRMTPNGSPIRNAGQG